MIAKLVRIRARGRPAGHNAVLDARHREPAVRRPPPLRAVRRLSAGEAAGGGARARAERALRARGGAPDEGPAAGATRASACGALRRAGRAGQAPGGSGARARRRAPPAPVTRRPRTLQHAEQLLVRLAEADRDPEMARESHGGAVPHEEASAQELLPER